MKFVWLAAAVGAALVAPAMAQQVAPEEPVKAGVDAWSRGDYSGAVQRWRGPAAAGNADAQFNLAQAYRLGRGVPQDLDQAELWYGKAAAQGHPQAQDNYGLTLFENAKRDPAKLDRAVPWLERSARRGEPRAQYVLGTMYFNGDSVGQNWPRAYALVMRASQSGLPQASAALAQMDKYMSLKDRQDGLALARKYEEDASRTDLADLGTPPLATTPSSTPSRPPRMIASPGAQTPAPIPDTVRRPAPPAVRDGGWRVQLGAFGDPGNARRLWAQVSGRFPGRQPYFVKAGALTKLLVGPFASRGEANGACGAVKPCVPVHP